MAGAAKSQKGRKIGRNAKSPQNTAYKNGLRRSLSKARRLTKHLKRFPADAAALSAYEAHARNQDTHLVRVCKEAAARIDRDERKAMSVKWKAEAKRRSSERSRATTMAWASAHGVADIVERGYATTRAVS